MGSGNVEKSTNEINDSDAHETRKTRWIRFFQGVGLPENPTLSCFFLKQMHHGKQGGYGNLFHWF